MYKFILILHLLSAQFTIYSQSTHLQQANSYTTKADRSNTVKQHCKQTSRLQLFNYYGLDGQIPHSSSVSSFFNLNTSIVEYAIDDKWDEVKRQLNKNGGKIFIWLGAWVIGLGIAVLLLPFLLCCCICPWKCPLWNRKHQKMPYSQFQLKYPAIISLFLLLIVIVCSIVGISSKYKAIPRTQDFSCVSGVVIDDLINGNTSLINPSMFFSGIRTIETELSKLNKNILVLNNQVVKLTPSSSQMNDTTNKLSISQTATNKVPNLDQSQLILNYSTPLQSLTTTSIVKSTFPKILGTKQNISIGSLVYSASKSLLLYESMLNQTSPSAKNYTQNIPSYTSSFKAGITQVNKTASDMQQQDLKLNDFFNKNTNTIHSVSISEYIIYGILIGVTVFMFLVIIFATWTNSHNCRYLMYIICVLVYLLCIFSFLVCIFASIVNPFTYYSCQYITQNLQSKSKFQETLTQRFNIDKYVASNISQCISADGSGLIAENLLGDSIYSSLTFLNTTYISLSKITTETAIQINKTHQYMQQNTTAYKQAQILDIEDENSLNQLNKLSKASSYSCLDKGFSKDSWIPSLKLKSNIINCQTITLSDSSACVSGNNFQSNTNGCSGCMDTYELFKTNTSTSSVKAALDARYADASCSVFNSQLSSTWNNFYKKKTDILGPVETRAINAKQNAVQVANSVSTFTDIKQNIDSNFSSIVNQQYGLLNGLNCKIANEDVRLMRNVFCQSIFVYTYFIRVIFGIISFALLFLLCCITCSGHRKCKQMQFYQEKRMKDKVDKMMNNQVQLQNNQGKQNLMSDQRLRVIQRQNVNPSSSPNKIPYLRPDQKYRHNNNMISAQNNKIYRNNYFNNGVNNQMNPYQTRRQFS